MKQIEKESRLIEFAKWQTNIESIVSKFQNLTKDEEGTVLDLSPNSLHEVECYLLNKYENPMDAYNIDNKTILEAAATYIGEVYRQNSEADLNWAVDLENESQSGIFNFHYYIKSSGSYVGFNPFSRIPFLLNKRTGEKLFQHYEHNEKLYQTEKGEIKTTTPFKGYSYGHYLIPKKNFWNKENLYKIVTEYCQRKNIGFQDKNNRISIKLKENYEIHIDIDNRKETQNEIKSFLLSRNIVSNHDTSCRLEIWGDKDQNAIYLNEFLLLIEHINANEEYFVLKTNE